MSWNQYQATQTSITGDTTNRLDYTPCRGLVHFTHVTWPAQLVPSLSFWVMIGRSPRRDCPGSSSSIPTRTGSTYQNSTSLYAGSSYHNLLSPTNRPFHYWHMVVHVSYTIKKPIN